MILPCCLSICSSVISLGFKNSLKNDSTTPISLKVLILGAQHAATLSYISILSVYLVSKNEPKCHSLMAFELHSFELQLVSSLHDGVYSTTCYRLILRYVLITYYTKCYFFLIIEDASRLLHTLLVLIYRLMCTFLTPFTSCCIFRSTFHLIQ